MIDHNTELHLPAIQTIQTVTFSDPHSSTVPAGHIQIMTIADLKEGGDGRRRDANIESSPVWDTSRITNAYQ